MNIINVYVCMYKYIRSAGGSTGPLSLGVIPQGELAQPRARATSSQVYTDI